ncbi:hypothetical protein IFM89_013432 [Coptis chinensis]|uniref:UDP-N-acetylglucosamine--dolichyl-phosphate N-acetylglucosaminephosphotransferase n=1 Tax=Coptis chinensis TaxID=261450 RepID=A0A835LBR4_9MAGN|nr:hypothetical protein IFM89_013432 [Coptis chinensis]
MPSLSRPESLGIVIGIVFFLVLAILFQCFNFISDSNWLVEYNAALASICFMILLGFVDDVLDIPWRVKLVLPAIATFPLLMAYTGHTTIIIPKPFIPYVGLKILDLGRIYKLYMVLLAIFCTNSINIHAGLNGLEAGQTAVIASAILIHNIMQIGSSTDPEQKHAHAFSIYLVQPSTYYYIGLTLLQLVKCILLQFLLVTPTLTLLEWLWLLLAYWAIIGRFPLVQVDTGSFETLLIFFLPQVLNFLASCPQLFSFIHCPRHRLPRYDPQTGLLTGTDDGTLVNIFLRLFGRCSEKSLCIRLLAFQVWHCVVPSVSFCGTFSLGGTNEAATNFTLISVVKWIDIME